MPKRNKEEYDADGGFVEDAPEGKKSKKGAANERQKAPMNTEMQRDEDGNGYWELSTRRRVGISNFKGSDFVNIREYYENGGKVMPGKKGISLSIDQYVAFINIMPQVECALKAKGLDIPRPNYDGFVPVGKAEEDEEVEAEDDQADAGEDAPDVKPARSKLDRFKMKANHEATSDEDEG